MMPHIDTTADYDDLCGESPLWDASAKQLFWTDINGKKFFQWSWHTKTTRLIHSGFESAGFVQQKSGGFVVVNSGGFWLWDGMNNPMLLTAAVDGNRCAQNDCIASPDGRVFSGSCFYDSTKTNYASGCLLRVDWDGRVSIMDEGMRLSNGLGFSPDGTTLYFTDSASRTIYAYDYRSLDGELHNRRVFVRVPRHEGIPDGLTVDADGFVWSAQWFGGALARYDPDGKMERRILLPASQITSLAFGGPDLTDIFVTSASFPDALPLAPEAYHPGFQYNGGKLYHLNLNIQGRQEHLARISPGTV